MECDRERRAACREAAPGAGNGPRGRDGAPSTGGKAAQFLPRAAATATGSAGSSARTGLRPGWQVARP